MRATVLLLACLVAVPGVTASLSAHAPSAPVPLVPDVASSVDVVFMADCQSTLGSAPDPSIRVEPVPETGLTVEGPRTVALDATSCAARPGGSASGNATYRITASHSVPAGFLQLRADLRQGGLGANRASAVLANVSVVPMPAITLNATTTEASGGPQKQLVYSIRVSNVGNDDVAVSFTATSPDAQGRWQLVAPAQVILTRPEADATSTGQGGRSSDASSKLVSFLVSTPYKNGANSDAADFLLTATAMDTKSQAQSQPVSVTLHGHSHGLYIPGPSPILVLLVLAGLVVLARRRAM